MSWEMPLLSEVEVQEQDTTRKGFDLLAEDTYTFTLLPSSAFDETRQRLNIAVAVADGPAKGRRVFPDLPKAKSKNDWPNQVLARISTVTGVDAVPGETPESFLNRIAANGNARFSARAYHNKYTKSDGTEGVSVKLDFRSIGVAA